MKTKYLLLVFVLESVACTRSYMVKSDSTNIAVEQVNVLAVEYHRPNYETPDHDDFKVKNRKIDCMVADELWKDLVLNQVKVRECLNSLEDGTATYFYVPNAQPHLELDLEEEKNHQCLNSVLSKIPLPREIYYLGKQANHTLDEDPLECFSSSFSTTTNQLAMTPTGFLKKKIVLEFPIDRPLKNIRDLSMWLMVTTFTILKSDEKAEGKLLATPVPESVCRACFKRDALFDDKLNRKLKPVFWP